MFLSICLSKKDIEAIEFLGLIKKIFSKNKAEIRMLVNKLFKSSQTVSGLNKQDLEMLLLTTKKKNLFDQKYYAQTDGVIMDSLLGSTLTNVIT